MRAFERECYGGSVSPYPLNSSQLTDNSLVTRRPRY